MQFRRKPRKLKDRPLLPVIIVSTPILLIFAIAHFVRDPSLNAAAVAADIQMKKEAGVIPRGQLQPDVIVYNSVESGRKDAVRFEAMGVEQDGTRRVLTVTEWAELMSQNDTKVATALAMNFTQTLRDLPFHGMRWETKGVTSETAPSTKMEFAVVNDESLYEFADKNPDEQAFAKHLQCDGASQDWSTGAVGTMVPGCVFTNLGKNAILVSPKKLGEKKAYGHLAAFVRSAPDNQIAAFWSLVATTYLETLEDRDAQNPLWLSTAGGGVAWLHVRLDDRPKYYHYQPFKKAAGRALRWF